MIPQSFIDTLLNQTDIVDVVGAHIELKKAGANHSACCPFHTEKSPSFTVSQRKQFYHCFGCGAHGTAISFLMEYAGMGFVDAIEELARKAGLAVPREQNRKNEGRSEYDQCADLIGQAAAFYQKELAKSDAAQQYVATRGLNAQTMERFGIGYAPAGWQSLEPVYRDYSSSEMLVKSGMLIEQADNPKRRYDRFRDRLMFPIRNRKGKTIGFGGRVLGAGEPKYLNSPESPCFNKGRELYGLFEAADAIKAAGRVLVVEGYMDVVALSQSGIHYAVATLGTATTPIHIQNLFRLTDRVIFSFDGDKAGQKAAWRALEVCLSLVTDDKHVSFLFLPEQHDPDSYVRENGTQRFEELLDRTIPLSAFLLQGLGQGLALATAEGKATLIARAAAHLAHIYNAPALAAAIRSDLAGATSLPLSEICTLTRRQDSVGAAAVVAVGAQPLSPALSLFRLLALAPQFARSLDFEVERDVCGEDGDALYALVRIIRDNPGIKTAAGIFEHQRDLYIGDLVAQLAMNDTLGDMEAYDLSAEIDGALKQFQRFTIQRKIDALLAKGPVLDGEDKVRLKDLLAEHASV